MPHAPIWGLKFIEHWINVLRKHFVRKIANNKATLSSLSVLLFSSRKKITFTKMFKSSSDQFHFVSPFKKKKRKKIRISNPIFIPFQFHYQIVFHLNSWYRRNDTNHRGERNFPFLISKKMIVKEKHLKQ